MILEISPIDDLIRELADGPVPMPRTGTAGLDVGGIPHSAFGASTIVADTQGMIRESEDGEH